MLKQLKSLYDDFLFQRVLLFYWGLPFIAVFVFSLINIHELNGFEWLFIAPICLNILGLWLIHISLFAEDSRIEKTLNYMNDGGDFLGIVFALLVVVVALPTWWLLKWLRADK